MAAGSVDFGTDDRPARVLIVEDEALVAWDVGKTLSQHGFEVCGIAYAADDAVALAARVQPDIVLMDIHLAGNSDGIEAAKVISSATPADIIFVSAYWNEDMAKRAAPARARAFVAKPFTTRHLLDTLARVVQDRVCHGRI